MRLYLCHCSTGRKRRCHARAAGSDRALCGRKALSNSVSKELRFSHRQVAVLVDCKPCRLKIARNV